MANTLAETTFRLPGAQLTLARHYGFASWPKLRTHVEAIIRLSRWPHLVEALADPADELLRLGCLTYDAYWRTRPEQARELLAARPELARASLPTMAAGGDWHAAELLLDAIHRVDGRVRWR